MPRLANQSVVLLWQVLDEVMGMGLFGGGHNLSLGGTRIAVPDIFKQGTVKQGSVLWHKRNRGPKANPG